MLNLSLGADQDPVAAMAQAQSARLPAEASAPHDTRSGFDAIADEAFFRLVLARLDHFLTRRGARSEHAAAGARYAADIR